jgi:LmbE family N-acetylglucosaminyl deacetylase
LLRGNLRRDRIVRGVGLSVVPGRQGLVVLCLGAHADDIEIGCGGTVLRLLSAYPDATCRWVVLSGAGEREREARDSADRFVLAAAQRRVDVHQFRDGHFPAELSRIKEVLEKVKRESAPDVIFTHFRDDAHQDHRLISEVTWQTFRDHLILEYEVPKWDGDLGRPGLYVPLPKDAAVRKVKHLLAAFPSQRTKPWFTEDTFFGLMRLRGVECRAPDGYAEGFYARKIVLQL